MGRFLLLLAHGRVVAEAVGDAGAFKSNLHWRDPPLVLELEQSWHYPVAQGLRVNGVDVNFGATLEAGGR